MTAEFCSKEREGKKKRVGAPNCHPKRRKRRRKECPTATGKRKFRKRNWFRKGPRQFERGGGGTL